MVLPHSLILTRVTIFNFCNKLFLVLLYKLQKPYYDYKEMFGVCVIAHLI